MTLARRQVVGNGSSPARGKGAPHPLIAQPFLLSLPSPSATTKHQEVMVHSLKGGLQSHLSQMLMLNCQAPMHLYSKNNNIPFEIIDGIGPWPACFPQTFFRQWSHSYYTIQCLSIPQHKHVRRCCCRKGRGLSDLWLIHSSSSCQANITLSEGSMWHSITMRGCDRTSPFPLHSLRAISDIASLLLCNAVYFSCLHWWIPYCRVSLSGH